MPESEPLDSTYEFSLAGGLGPVLGHALSPHRAPRTESCTVLRTAADDAADLVQLVGALESRGLRVEGVALIGTQ